MLFGLNKEFDGSILANGNNLSDCQYGGESEKKYVSVMLTLDIESALSSASWSQIKRALAKVRIPRYLANLVKNYLSEKTLWYRMTDEPQEIRHFRGTTTGLGSISSGWNVIYIHIIELLCFLSQRRL